MGPTVMLAIWEKSLLHVMNNKLRELNFDVVVVENGSELAQQTATRDIDVILLDIRSDGESGLRLMTEAREKKPETEVILLSNQQCIALAMEGIQAGAFDDIPEPFEVDKISKKILAAWKRKKRSKRSGLNRLAVFWEKTMMAAAYAEAGDFETAISLAGRGKKKKKTPKKLAKKEENVPPTDKTKGDSK
jgi:DNA-binding NtrC family response regulator